MRRKIQWITVGVVSALALLVGTAYAQYRSSAQGEAAESGEGSFGRAVDTSRFRKGNPEWDTQELISSGLTALHGEHVQILREMEELKAAVARLEKNQ